ncbi:MAG: glycosyltransferase family 4 protein [Deltaproteobacteria bacterium]|nr:glycosyltransferase family 4 protein [Deltaproteobacteria bacterium]
MRICFVSNLYPPFIVGGAEVSVKRIAEELTKQGHIISIITTSPNRKNYSEIIHNVTVYRINPMNIFPYFAMSKQAKSIKPLYFFYDLFNPYPYLIIKKILKKEKVDIVHINNFRGLSLPVFSAVKSLNIPLVFTAHDYSLTCIKSTFLNSSNEICMNPSKLCKVYVNIQRFLVNNKPEIVLAPSQFVLDKIQETGFFKNIRTLKFPLGIELCEKRTIKDYNKIDILFVGSLSWHKGIHILINAFSKLEYENISLHIIGKGKNEDEIRNLAYSDNRIIVHGFVSDNELTKLYQKANITVVPSIWYDNSPMVIYESLMNGSPVIGSRIGGIPELVEEGYNGYLFEPGNEEELRKIIESLIPDTVRLMRLVDGAYESAKKYNINGHIQNLEKLYRDIQR